MRNIISLVIISSNNILFFFFFSKIKTFKLLLVWSDHIPALSFTSHTMFCFVLFYLQNYLSGTYVLLVFSFYILHLPPTNWVFCADFFFFSLKVTFILEVVIICILSSPYHSKFSQGFKDLIYRPCIAEFKPCIGKHLQTYCVCHFSHPQPTPVPPI